ncbi:MAG: hypothetical protein AAF423_07360 [Pseudomonadota bacterium]
MTANVKDAPDDTRQDKLTNSSEIVRLEKHFELNRRKLTFLVGLVTLLLPTIMILSSWSGLVQWRDSISHYYYAAWLGDLFVVFVAFIGTFMIAYEGRTDRETHLATAAGCASFGIGIFPTSYSGLENMTSEGALARIFIQITSINEPNKGDLVIEVPTTVVNEIPAPLFGDTACAVGSAFCLFPYSASLHYVCAAFVFGFLTWYCLFIFTRVDPERHKHNNEITTQKTIRNTIYYLCGGVMLICLIAMGLRFFLGKDWIWWEEWDVTFWAETFSLYAFGIGWLVRSRFRGTYLVDPAELEMTKSETG